MTLELIPPPFYFQKADLTGVRSMDEEAGGALFSLSTFPESVTFSVPAKRILKSCYRKSCEINDLNITGQMHELYVSVPFTAT